MNEMTREDQYNFTLTSGKIVGLISGLLCAMLACFVAGLFIGRSSEQEVSAPPTAAAPPPAPAGIAKPAEVSLPEAAKPAQRRAAAPSPTRGTEVARTTTPAPSSTPPPAPAPAVSSPELPYTICVLSVRQKEGAERFAEQLRNQGYKASVKQTQEESGTVWYRAVIGEFADREAAEQQMKELKSKGKFSDAFVIKL
jgi:cell division septation protein DedD